MPISCRCVGGRIVVGRVDLRGEQDLLVLLHDLIERANGLLAADKKRRGHVRENDDVAQRQDRIASAPCSRPFVAPSWEAVRIRPFQASGPALTNENVRRRVVARLAPPERVLQVSPTHPDRLEARMGEARRDRQPGSPRHQPAKPDCKNAASATFSLDSASRRLRRPAVGVDVEAASRGLPQRQPNHHSLPHRAWLGSSNMVSSRMLSMIERRPRAPVLRCDGLAGDRFQALRPGT